MIEDIEKLSAELQVEALVELCILQDGEIPIVHSGAMKEPPVCVPSLPKSGPLKRTGIEKETRSRARRVSRIQDMHGSDKVGSVHAKGNRPTKVGA